MPITTPHKPFMSGSRNAPPSLSPSSPSIYGVAESDRARLALTATLAAHIAESLPSSCTAGTYSSGMKWYLLYSSNIDGKSFQRLVQRLTSQGPTVLVIKLKGSARVIGAFCESDWLTVAEREKTAKSAAAASARAAREGQARPGATAPKNQNNVFFGNENCFLFRADAESCDAASDEGEIFKSRSSMNSNFMYLFDTHPLEDKVGIGMGGQPGYFGWFIDRWLESGASYGARCTTFDNPRLTPSETWTVESVEAYAVKREVVETLQREGNSTLTGVSCVTANPDRKADQLLMELNGTHQFNQRDRPDC